LIPTAEAKEGLFNVKAQNNFFSIGGGFNIKSI
jgi:hypothetical protein